MFASTSIFTAKHMLLFFSFPSLFLDIYQNDSEPQRLIMRRAFILKARIVSDEKLLRKQPVPADKHKTRRTVNSIKLTYSARDSPTFTFTVPTSLFTHPQKKLVSPSEKPWKDIDTSFCDTGELFETMPTDVDETTAVSALRGGEVDRDPSELGLADLQEVASRLQELCKSYVLMDTDGMQSRSQIRELNSGPDYDSLDQSLRRRRTWFAVFDRFQELREILWRRSESPNSRSKQNKRMSQQESRKPQEQLSAQDMYETLRWVESANINGVRVKRQYEDEPEEKFQPLKLHREVEIFAEVVSATGGDFFSGENGFTRLITCCALARNHDVPIDSFFRSKSGRNALSSLYECISVKACANEGGIKQEAALALLCSISELDKRALVVLSNSKNKSNKKKQKQAPRRDDKKIAAFKVLFDALTRSNALIYTDGFSLRNYLKFCNDLMDANPTAVWSTGEVHAEQNRSDCATEIPLPLPYYIGVGIGRCRTLLYHRESSVGTMIYSEDGLLPAADRVSRNGLKLNNNLVKHYAEGMRQIVLSSHSASSLLEQAVRCAKREPKYKQLVGDLLQHIGLQASKKLAWMTIGDISTTLSILGSAMESLSASSSSSSDIMTSGLSMAALRGKATQLASLMDQRIGQQISQVTTPALLADLLSAMAAVRCRFTCRTALEMKLLAFLDVCSMPQLAQAAQALTRLGTPAAYFAPLVELAEKLVVKGLKNRPGGLDDLVLFCHALLVAGFPDVNSLVTRLFPKWTLQAASSSVAVSQPLQPFIIELLSLHENGARTAAELLSRLFKKPSISNDLEGRDLHAVIASYFTLMSKKLVRSAHRKQLVQFVRMTTAARQVRLSSASQAAGILYGIARLTHSLSDAVSQRIMFWLGVQLRRAIDNFDHPQRAIEVPYEYWLDNGGLLQWDEAVKASLAVSAAISQADRKEEPPSAPPGSIGSICRTVGCVLVREIMQRDEAASSDVLLPSPSQTGFEVTHLAAAARSREAKASGAELIAALHALCLDDFAEEEYARARRKQSAY